MGVRPNGGRLRRAGESACCLDTGVDVGLDRRLTIWFQGSGFQMSDLKDPGVSKPLVIGIMLMVFQQMTGINAIMFYAETIFQQAHFKVSQSHFASHTTAPCFCRVLSPLLRICWGCSVPAGGGDGVDEVSQIRVYGLLRPHRCPFRQQTGI